MARTLRPNAASFFIFFSIFFFLTTEVDGKFKRYTRTLSSTMIGLKREKLSHFRLYWHDILSGRNPTAIKVAGPPTNTSTTRFGFTYVIDDALTEGPNMSSKLIGRAQGFYASASQSEVGLIMGMNFAFMEGKYNGSTITILGRNTVFSKVREMPIIGGTGLFRFARGYVQVRTYKFKSGSGDATVEYNIFVIHY